MLMLRCVNRRVLGDARTFNHGMCSGKHAGQKHIWLKVREQLQWWTWPFDALVYYFIRFQRMSLIMTATFPVEDVKPVQGLRPFSLGKAEGKRKPKQCRAGLWPSDWVDVLSPCFSPWGTSVNPPEPSDPSLFWALSTLAFPENPVSGLQWAEDFLAMS